MTALTKLLAQKRELIARLQREDIGPEERDEIERCWRRLKRPSTCSTRLDRAGPEPPASSAYSIQTARIGDDQKAPRRDNVATWVALFFVAEIVLM